MYNSNHKSQIVEVPLITQGDNILIDARLLHKNLNINTKFSMWIKKRIQEYGFEHGKDFFPNLGKSQFGRPQHEYHLTIDMAKELAMLERNEVGRAIRRYFIAREKQARGIVQLPRKNEVFRGLPSKRVNGRTMLPYKEVRRRCGYSTKSSSQNHKERYWMHFIKEDNLLYVTEEFANHLYYQKKLMINRTTLQASQAVIPMNFGDTSVLKKGGVYGNL